MFITKTFNSANISSWCCLAWWYTPYWFPFSFMAFPKTLILTNINWWFVIGFAIIPDGM
jgi:hypothetical protein